MKRFYLFFIPLLVIAGCKKGGDGGTSTTTTNPPPDNPPTIPSNAKGGMVVASSKKIILHKGDQVSLSADAYDVNGNQVTSALQWSSTSTAIASASQGTIKAQSIGETIIKVGDGTNAEDYIIVSVVADTVAIPTGAANIKFSSPAIALKKGSTATIPAYTLTDYKGRTVSGTPVFEFVNFDKATIQGNTIGAGNNAGTGLLLAKVNGVYLNGSLLVTVYGSTATDTIRSFHIVGRYPSAFNYYNETAGPVAIEVSESWTNPSGFHWHWYQTYPDKVISDYPEVISVNDKGEFTSKGPGITPITLSYKGISLKLFSGVNVDMSGSWGGGGYSFCVNKSLPPVIYDAFNLFTEADMKMGIMSVFDFTALNSVPGKSNIKNLTTSTLYNTCMVFSGPNCGCGPSIGPFNVANARLGMIWVGPAPSGLPMKTYTMKWINDLDAVQLDNGVKLVRGAGDCENIQGGSLTLEMAMSGGSSKTWITNQCFRDNYDPLSITFYSNHTYTYTHEADNSIHWDIPVAWSAPDNNSFKMSYYRYNPVTKKYDELLEDIIKINSYTESRLNLNAKQLDIDNCDPFWTKQ